MPGECRILGAKLLEFDQDLHICLVFAILNTQKPFKVRGPTCVLLFNISKPECASESPGELVKTDCSAPLLEILIQ